MNKAVFLLALLSSGYCRAYNNYDEAAQKAAEAYYVQSGLSTIVDTNVKELQKNLPEYCKKTLDVIVPIVDTIVKQRVELKYEF